MELYYIKTYETIIDWFIIKLLHTILYVNLFE